MRGWGWSGWLRPTVFAASGLNSGAKIFRYPTNLMGLHPPFLAPLIVIPAGSAQRLWVPACAGMSGREGMRRDELSVFWAARAMLVSFPFTSSQRLLANACSDVKDALRV